MPEWRISDRAIPYEAAIAEMEARVEAIRRGEAPELVWLLEHPPLYSGGTSARAADSFNPQGFPVHASGRGGQYTYHGPGQRIGYVMLDLKPRGNDVRRYVRDLEEWLIRSLESFNVRAERRAGRIGLWVTETDGRENKIAALGVRIRHGIAFHGVALNVDPDLSHYSGIVPCGIREHGVTSLADQGILVSMPEVDIVLRQAFGEVFG